MISIHYQSFLFSYSVKQVRFVFVFCHLRYMQSYKSKRIITPSDMMIYGESDKLKEIVDVLQTKDGKLYSQQQAVLCRNHLMVMLAFGNAARASNLINITLADVDNATKEIDFDAWSFSSCNYKTSLLYGEKKMYLAEDLMEEVKVFVKCLRPKITDDAEKARDERPLFTSTRGEGNFMNHSCVSNGMTTLFNSVKGFAGQERCDVFSLITNLDNYEFLSMSVSNFF